MKIQVINHLATITITHQYVNDADQPIEASMDFPDISSFTVSKMKARLGEKEIESKVMKIEKANQVYNDSIAKGNMGFLLS